MSVYLDYGHWHLMPALEKPLLQWLGLAIFFLDSIWLIWVDTHLSKQFAGGLSARRLMTEGPYRFVRHPRYTALIISRFTFALALASVVAWILALGWLLVNLRRIRLEEAHLRRLFPAEYDDYAARTPHLFPGIY
jgi:protein-S-isoprenylcysteine O-methyltransferase